MKPFATLAAVACLLASCQSMAEGILTVEARAFVLQQAEIDELEDSDEDDVEVRGYGAHAALMTPIVDVLGGIDYRDYEEDAEGDGSVDDSTPEIVLGVRRRIFELWRLHPFIEGNLRYGADLEDVEDYAAWAVGVGAMLDLTENLFLTARVMYEETPLDSSGDGPNRDLEAYVGTLGLGISL